MISLIKNRLIKKIITKNVRLGDMYTNIKIFINNMINNVVYHAN